MAGEREVLEGVPEVVSNVVVEKCGLDMSSYQDLPKSNGINHVSGDSIYNSYVFVSEADKPVDVVAGPVDLVGNPETLTSGHHLNSEEFSVGIIPNGDNLEPADGIVDGSDAIVGNLDSPLKETVDAVLVDATNLEMSRDGGLGNLDAESVEVKSESAPSILTIEDQDSQVVSADSLELPIGAVTTVSEAEVVLETSIQHPQSQESKVVLLEENTGAGGSEELKAVSSFVDNCGDQTESTDKTISQESVESPGVVLNINSESSQCKDMERVALGVDCIKEENKEIMHISSDELSHGHDSRGVILAGNVEAGQSEDLDGLMLGVNDSDNHSKASMGTILGTSDESSLCQDSEVVISKANAESEEIKDLESIAPDTNNTSKDNQETMVAISETSEELSLGQDSQDVELEADSQSGDGAGPSDVKEAGDEHKEGASKLVECNQPIEAQECEAVELRQDPEPDVSILSVDAVDVKETGNEYTEGAAKLEDCDQPIDVQECEAVELRQDPEPDVSILSVDAVGVKETGNEYTEGAAKLEDCNQPIEVQECEAVELRQDPEPDVSILSVDAVGVKETGNEYTEGAAKLENCDQPIEVQECEAMELKQDSEPGISRESITLSKEIGDEDQESKAKQCETSDDLTEVQGAPNFVEGDQYQLEESETEKSNQKEQNDFESFNDNNEEHECKGVSSEAPACQSEDVKTVTQRDDLELEAENAQQLEEGGTTQVSGVLQDLGVCQLDVDSKQESDRPDIQDNLINVRMQHTINETAVAENVPDQASCQNEFDSCSPQSKEIVPQHDEPCEQTYGSVNFTFGSLRTETKMNSTPDKSNESLGLDSEDATTDHEVNNQASTLSESDDVERCLVGDSLSTETKNKPGRNDEGFASDCQDGTIVHEIDLQAPMRSSTECTDDASACPFDDTSSGNIESGVTADNGVSYLANEVGLEAETFEPIDSRSKSLSIQDDDAHAEDVNVASNLNVHMASNLNVHTSSDAMITMVLESSNKECVTNLFSGMAEVKSAGDDFNGGDKSKEVNPISQDIGERDESLSSEVSADLTGSSTSATAGQELEEVMRRPFNFLVKLPRFDDDKLREQIRHAQLEVDEKTQHRDAFRVQIQNKRPNLHAFDVEYNVSVSEEIDARRLLKATRNKIESLQSLIGRMKNAISVEDIDARIHNIEHRMQHETMPLKEEKQSIREIKQLKQHREYLSSTIGSQDEIQQALDQKDQNEDRLKALKKELIGLKEKVSTAQAAAATVGKKYENENKLIKELQNQYRVANDVRQEAYENLLSLKKKLYEKNEHFRKYKNDVAAASDYAFSRNKSALHRLCAGQMEMMMELWNNNDEFRNDYVRCNLRSTVRRLGTVDGRSLGPNEEPPMLPSYAIVRVDRSTSNPDKSSSIAETAMEKKTETNIATVVADRKPVTEMTGSVKQPVKILEPARSSLANGIASSSGANVSTGINGELLQAKEENASARKVEDSRKEVEAAYLKEQDQLDVIAKAKEELERKKLHEIEKAKEAVERKKRMAEKAQIRAELRARKEAEQREKEREKRLRKKERRAGDAPESGNHGEILTSSDSGIETVAEPAEVKESSAAVARRPQKPSQFVKQSKSKSIPPPLRIRNRRRFQQWVWVTVTCVLVFALFFLGNIGLFSKVRPRKFGGY